MSVVNQCWIIGAVIALPLVGMWRKYESDNPSPLNSLWRFDPLVALLVWLVVTNALALSLFWMGGLCAWLMKAARR